MIASNGLPLPGCCGQQRALAVELWLIECGFPRWTVGKRLWLLSTVANELWLSWY